MGLYNILIEFLQINWQGILITLLIGFLFFVLTPWGLKKYLTTAEIERRNRAKENVLDLLESSLINKQDLNSEKIYHLLNAIGREYELNIFSYFTVKSLLEDLELRFEKSKHLDTSQKQDYTSKIETLIIDLETADGSSKVSASYNNLFETLTQSINEGNKEVALKTIKIIKKKLIIEPSIVEKVFVETIRRFATMPLWQLVITEVILILLLYTLINIFAQLMSNFPVVIQR